MVSVELSPCGKASRSRGICIKPMMGGQVVYSQEGEVGIEWRGYVDMRRCDPVYGGIVRGEVRGGDVEAKMRSNSPGSCTERTRRYKEWRVRRSGSIYQRTVRICTPLQSQGSELTHKVAILFEWTRVHGQGGTKARIHERRLVHEPKQ